MIEAAQKVSAAHLKRNAYLYVRQSTPQAGLGTCRKHGAPVCTAPAGSRIGWPTEQIVVIDSDLGQSGAYAADRDGFQKLVAEVSLGHVGLVLGLEVSRLARKLCGVAPSAGVMRLLRYAHPRRGRHLQPRAVQRSPAARVEGHDE